MSHLPLLRLFRLLPLQSPWLHGLRGLWLQCLIGAVILAVPQGLQAQTDDPSAPPPVPPAKTADTEPLQPQTDASTTPDDAPTLVVNPLAPGKYVLEFSRSPIVGQRFQLRGIYDEARLQFTRPRNWQTKTLKLQLRFRHSGALYATRSNLTALVNGTVVGSFPLNRKDGEISTTTFNVPAKLIQDYNEVVIAALQNNSPTCTQDPFDPSLWTEVLPDSKLIFDFQPQPIGLDFSRYPYPVFDNLNLEPNQIAYLMPKQVDETWLTAAARFQTVLGRYAQFRPMETRLTDDMADMKANERLVLIGTPQSQPLMGQLKLPLPLQDNQWQTQNNRPLPPDTGVLILTTTQSGNNLVLIASGNSPAGVTKAVQFLVQARDRQLGTGQAIMVNAIEEVPSPPLREWPNYLPPQDKFQLKDLKDLNETSLEDVTVRGSEAPPIEYNFRALPDDTFQSGNTLVLHYSYSPQVNPLTSLLEVQLDGRAIVGKRLDSTKGGFRETLKVDLPEGRITPQSKLQVRFQLDSREQRSCNRAIDQQLWGTVHSDTEVNLKRQTIGRLPDLRLLQSAYPFAAPQDLSQLAIVLPNKVTPVDLQVMFQVVERLGRLSKANSVKLNVYRQGYLTDEQRRANHWIAIGAQADFPMPEVFATEGFALKELSARQSGQSQLLTLPDQQGVLQQMVSPWNAERSILALTAQTEQGLVHLQALFQRDDLFFQLRDDTLLISANDPKPLPYDPQAYTLEFLKKAQHTQELRSDKPIQRFTQELQNIWILLVPTTIGGSFILYGVAQAWLTRVRSEEKK